MYNPNMSLSLARALRMEESNCIAFAGSGGKTTALFQLARQLTPPVIVTAASHLGAWQVSMADRHVIANFPSAVDDLENDLSGVVLMTGSLDEDRTKPVSSDVLDSIREFCLERSLPLLIEADGSRQKPVKGWAEHEPPIPAFVEHVVTVAGLSGLGKPLGGEFAHRPELFSKLGGLQIGETIDANALTRVLLHEESSLKNIPPHARRTVLLNQADNPELQASAGAMSQALLSKYHSVVVARLEQEKVFAAHESVAGIVLAAGESSRYGAPKQLLDWKGEPFVRVSAKRALEAGLSPVIVVTGAYAEQVESAVNDLGVKTVRNNKWKDGQSASVKAGISSIQADQAGAAIFLLADQPQITASVLQALIEKHAEGLASIIAPMVMDRRANPVLFDRRTFPDLLTLEGDAGGRAVFHKHRVEYLPWHDDRLLFDVDTPEQYRRLRADETL